MLDVALAQRLIEKIMYHTDYNVNLMDEKGIIIASTDASRVGDFHEIALKIIEKEQDIIEVRGNEDYLGVKRGVNMALMSGKRIIGVVGVTGIPEQVRNVATVIRMAVESMLEYELIREKNEYHRSARDKFLNHLLYKEDADCEGLKREAGNLGYEDNRIRIPIMISFSDKVDLNKLLLRLREGKNVKRQDIFSITKEEKLLVFASIQGEFGEVFGSYKYLAGEYLSDFLNYMRAEGMKFSTYVGALQNNFQNYRMSYRQCLWLERHVDNRGIGVYFYDHLDEYLKSQIPVMELHKIFGIFQMNLDEEYKNNFITLIGALYENNYNLESSSKALFVHRNTLSFRLEKIKSLLGINPLQNSKDRNLADYLYFYLKRMN